jgi:hypothetical protein
MIFRVFGLVIVSGFACLSTAKAESWRGESLALMVADSDMVVRGVVTAIEADGKEPRTKVSVAVAETFKGTKQKQLDLILPRDVPELLEGSRDAKRDILLCAVKAGKDFHLAQAKADADRIPWTIRKTYGSRFCVFSLDNLSKPKEKPRRAEARAFTLDFRILLSREAILEEAAAAARDIIVERKKRVHLDAPATSELHRAFWGGGAVALAVPLSRGTEKVAQRWAGSDDALDRANAVAVLRYFKSDDNIALLKKLLQDPAESSSIRGGFLIKSYYLRRSAFDILRNWKVEVREPVFEEIQPVPGEKQIS